MNASERTVLIIEDNPLIIKMVGLQLKQNGYQVISASNGFQGLNLARSASPDLILLDLMLPGIDGFEVLNLMRADPQTARVPVVIISAKSAQADIEMANRIGASGYLVKPFGTPELLAVLHGLLDERQEAPVLLGMGVAFVSARGGQTAPVVLSAGLALAHLGQAATVVDLHPYSVEHALLLGASSPEEPVALSDPETARNLSQRGWSHPSSLRLLHNLEGSGQANQLTPDDAQHALEALLAEKGLVLVDAPLYPLDVLRQAADCCARVVLVTSGDPVAIGAARTGLKMMERAGIATERVGLALIAGPGSDAGTELGCPIVARVPPGGRVGDPAYGGLVEWLHHLA